MEPQLTIQELAGARVMAHGGHYELGFADEGVLLCQKARRALQRALQRNESLNNACLAALTVQHKIAQRVGDNPAPPHWVEGRLVPQRSEPLTAPMRLLTDREAMRAW